MGDTVAFQLLKRPRNSIIPLEVSGAPAPHPDDLNGSSLMAPAAASTTKQPAGDASRGNDKGAVPGKYSTSQSSGSVWGETGSDLSGREASAVPECNRFAKFTTASDAAPLWVEAARELAQYAAEVRITSTVHPRKNLHQFMTFECDTALCLTLRNAPRKLVHGLAGFEMWMGKCSEEAGVFLRHVRGHILG